MISGRNLRGQKVFIVSHEELRLAIAENAGSPCVVVVTLHDKGPEKLVTALREVLEARCSYIVCAGPQAELLHDFADDLAMSENPELTVVTTWHTDESPEEILDFLFDVAAPRATISVIAILDCRDDELLRALEARILT